MNRYGRWKWYEYGLTAVNMTAAVYMANTIGTDWNEMSLTFNLAMLVMLLCVAALYSIQTKLKEQDTGAAKNSLTILAVDCLLYFSAFLASALHADQAVIWLDVAAVLMVAAFVLFYVSLFSDSRYYHERFSFSARDICISAISLVTGASVMIIGRNSIYGFLIGTLIAAFGNFGMLLFKYKWYRRL